MAELNEIVMIVVQADTALKSLDYRIVASLEGKVITLLLTGCKIR